VFLDRSVFRELKRRNAIREKESEKSKGGTAQKEKRRKPPKVVNSSVTSNPNQSLTRASETPRPRKVRRRLIINIISRECTAECPARWWLALSAVFWARKSARFLRRTFKSARHEGRAPFLVKRAFSVCCLVFALYVVNI